MGGQACPDGVGRGQFGLQGTKIFGGGIARNRHETRFVYVKSSPGSTLINVNGYGMCPVNKRCQALGRRAPPQDYSGWIGYGAEACLYTTDYWIARKLVPFYEWTPGISPA
jgi:hypothetical protein